MLAVQALSGILGAKQHRPFPGLVPFIAPCSSNHGLSVADHELQTHLRSLHSQLETVALGPRPTRMVWGEGWLRRSAPLMHLRVKREGVACDTSGSWE
jgi:hypothetical protein